jgi:hypothetical protein
MMEKEPMTDQTANIFTALAAAQIEMGAVTKALVKNPRFQQFMAGYRELLGL